MIINCCSLQIIKMSYTAGILGPNDIILPYCYWKYILIKFRTSLDNPNKINIDTKNIFSEPYKRQKQTENSFLRFDDKFLILSEVFSLPGNLPGTPLTYPPGNPLVAPSSQSMHYKRCSLVKEQPLIIRSSCKKYYITIKSLYITTNKEHNTPRSTLSYIRPATGLWPRLQNVS